MNENELQAESNQKLILEALFENGRLRFSDLQEKTGLSPPTLTKRLKSMKREGIVRRTRRAGERWPHYALESPEYLKEFMLPHFILAVLNKKYPGGTSLENLADNFGEMLFYILFKEQAGSRSHDIAINALIEIMRLTVSKWAEKGIHIESPDLDAYYKKYIEPDVGPDELRRISEEIL